MKYNLKTIKYDRDFLRQVSLDVKKNDSDLENDILLLSSYCKSNEIFALAAVQLGILKKIIYLKATSEDDMYKQNHDDGIVMINPEIIEEKGETYYWEYCMSCLDNMGLVKRPYMVKVRYYDENFNLKQESFEGLKATIISHEYDHLYGIFHMDIADKLCEVTFDERKEFRSKKENGYKVVSKTKKYKHPLR